MNDSASPYNQSLLQPSTPMPLQWFVLRDLKRNNARYPAYKMLPDNGIEVFTPLEHKVVIRGKKSAAEFVPVIPNLLFAHTTRALLDPIVEKTETLQYRFVRGGKFGQVMIVPERDMTTFVEHVNASSQQVKYYLPEQITPDMLGKQVRIVGGGLNDCIGTLISHRGSRRRHLQIELPGLLCAQIDVTDMEYIVLEG